MHSGCSSAPRTFAGAPVVLISIDTLRADRLPAYGYAQGSTPAMDALAREGIVFEEVYSPCPLTLPSHASLLTGLLPPHHGVRDNIGFTLRPGQETLASRLKAAGYRTGGAVSAYVLRAPTGIAQGFDFFDDAIDIEAGLESLGSVQRDGARTVETLTRWIDAQGDAPVLAFLHLYEPHSPYQPPERYSHLPTPYDGEVAYADELVGRFLERVKAHGIYDRALIVVTSDHGEGLKQHGEQEHGLFLYKETVHVPLIVRLPGASRAGLRVRGTVAEVDVAATLLDLAGHPAAGLDGVSLCAAIDAGRAAPRPVYSETFFPRYHFGWSELYAATEGRQRYIRAPRRELYDLGTDPGETRNLAGQNTATAAAMDDWLVRRTGIGEAARPEEMSAEVREKLQALGYVGSSPAVAPGTELPDPKDKVGAYEALRLATAQRRAGTLPAAAATLERLVKDDPEMIEAWELLGVTLIQMGRGREGIAPLKRALALDPGRASVHLELAKTYALEGRADLAGQHAEIASSGDPAQGYEVLAELMMDRGDLARAAEFARKSVAADEQRIMSQFILGVVAQRAGRCPEAVALFRKAEEAARFRKRAVVRNLHANAGDCLARLGREAEAEKEFLAEIDAIPTTREGRFGLAALYRSQGKDGQAREVLGGLIAASPNPGPDTYWAVVHALTQLDDRDGARAWAAQARQRFPSDPRFR